MDFISTQLLFFEFARMHSIVYYILYQIYNRLARSLVYLPSTAKEDMCV